MNDINITILWHIESPASIFRHFQGHSMIFSHVKTYWWILIRHIQALLRNTEPQSGIFGTLRNLCICDCAKFRTLAYLESKVFPKACWACKMIMYIQSPRIVRTVYSSIFKDIETYSLVLMHIQPHSQACN